MVDGITLQLAFYHMGCPCLAEWPLHPEQVYSSQEIVSDPRAILTLCPLASLRGMLPSERPCMKASGSVHVGRCFFLLAA